MERAVLVTGGAGFIGSHTAYLFAQLGIPVIILDDLRHGYEVDFPWARVFRGDYSDAVLLKQIFTKYEIELVVHCAASIEVGESEKNPREYYDNNVTKTIKLLDTMLAHGVKQLVFSSSCAVYGDPVTLPITEDHQRNPVSVYGNNKLCIELVLEDYARVYGLQFVALRYFNAAGGIPHVVPGERHNPESHLIPLLLRAMHAGKTFALFGDDYPTPDGSCVRDFVHVVDIADAHVKAYRYLQAGRTSGFFNLGTGKGYSVKQIIATAEQISNMKAVVEVLPRRLGDAAQLVADATRARTLLEWVPQHSDIVTLVTSALAWEQKTRIGAMRSKTRMSVASRT